MRSASIAATLSCMAFLAGCDDPNAGGTAPQSQADAASSMDIGDHVVHFSAQRTDQLPPEIARLYNIVRSENRAMLNVSVISEETAKSVPAQVDVKTVNLTGQLKNINMRRIDEDDAIYYIGETPIANRETLVFDITVQPEGVGEPAQMRVKRQFFTDR